METSSNEVCKDFDALINGLIVSAKNLVQKFGEFYPFGGVISVIGKFELAEAVTDSERPTVPEVVSALTGPLVAGLRDNRFRAFGVCINVSTLHPRTGKQIDAIRITAQHKSGQKVVYFVPYRKKGQQYEFREGYFQ